MRDLGLANVEETTFGEKLPVGGYVVRITSDAEALPACPNCGHHEFTKLED